MGKLVCLIGDARTPKQWDAMSGLEVLLNITGNDTISVNRKFKDQLAGQRLMCRITMASNEWLEIPDHAGAMSRRLNVIDFTRSFKGREDFGLPAKLHEELPGIAVWALGGLRRLRQQGVFTMPASSATALDEWKLTSSPVAAFLEECTDIGGEVLKEELNDVWTKWSGERKMWQLSKSRFYERVRTNAPYCSALTYEKGGHKFSVFQGISLKPWARKKYLGF
jgi:putative DNA primase/helicase